VPPCKGRPGRGRRSRRVVCGRLAAPCSRAPPSSGARQLFLLALARSPPPAGIPAADTQSRPAGRATCLSARTPDEFIFTCPCRLPPARLFLSRSLREDRRTSLDPVDAARRRAVLVVVVLAQGARGCVRVCWEQARPGQRVRGGASCHRGT
jgi:hypothetical protein